MKKEDREKEILKFELEKIKLRLEKIKINNINEINHTNQYIYVKIAILIVILGIIFKILNEITGWGLWIMTIALFFLIYHASSIVNKEYSGVEKPKNKIKLFFWNILKIKDYKGIKKMYEKEIDKLIKDIGELEGKIK